MERTKDLEFEPEVATPPAGRVMLVENTAWSLVNFRLPLIRTLKENGFEVLTASPPDEYASKLTTEGIHHVPIPMSRKGTNPVEDAVLAWRLLLLFRKARPDMVMTYRAKPTIYGSLAAGCLGIPVVNTITGLGAMFVDETLLTRLAKELYRLALRRSRRVYFQNGEDLELFRQERIVRTARAHLIAGSGVDTDRFSPGPADGSEDPFVFLLTARLIRDKGIGEYAEAARILRARGRSVECRVVGFFDPGNPAAISPEQIDAWEDEGSIRYLGRSDDVVQHMRAADCIVLPSYYREGIPRTLIEGASVGRPLIAADMSGSREVVVDGVNGFLCRPRDADDLADRMEAMLRTSPEERRRMGKAGREKALREFDERIVLGRYLEVAKSLTATRNGASTRQASYGQGRSGIRTGR